MRAAAPSGTFAADVCAPCTEGRHDRKGALRHKLGAERADGRRLGFAATTLADPSQDKRSAATAQRPWAIAAPAQAVVVVPVAVPGGGSISSISSSSDD